MATIPHRAMRTSALLALAILALSPGVGAAGVTRAAGSPLAWLGNRNYSALERYYSRAQRQFESGKLDDRQLYARFRELYQDSPGNERYFNEWVSRYPHSYSARVARGAYLYRRALHLEADEYYDFTVRQFDAHFEAIHGYLERARLDLRASLRMTAKPYLSALYLLNVAILGGSSADCRRWLRRGDAIEPTNYLVRLRYMFCLLPWRHGSYAQMLGFLRQSVAQPVDSWQFEMFALFIRNTLAADVVPADEFRSVSRELMQVLRLAVQAHRKSPTGFLVAYTDVAWRLRRRADVHWGLRQLSKRHLNDAWGMAQIGWIYSEEHRYYKAWPLLTSAAALNDRWSQFGVGLTIYRGCADLDLPANRPLGLVWIKRAADQCSPGADLFLRIRGRSVPARCSNMRDRLPGSASAALVALLESVEISIGHTFATDNMARLP